MADHDDWMPGPRSDILSMCGNWITYMTSDRRTAWGVPAAQFSELGTLFGAAQELLQKAKNTAERTSVITGLLRTAFDALEAKMRFFKNHYFLMPPLSEADILSLGLAIHDPHHTPIPPPGGTPRAVLSYHGAPHVVMAHLGPMEGTEPLDPRSNYGYALYVAVMPQGGATLEQAASEKHYLMTVPQNGDPLRHYRFTRRRNEEIVFGPEDSGMTAYVCARYENGKGETGNWGPVTWIVVP
jgi:hypothetical protein